MTTLPNTTHALLRDSLLDGAIAAGKLSSGNRQKWAAMYDVDPERATLMVAKLVPTAVTAAVARTPEPSTDSYDANWFSKAERSRVSAAEAGPTGEPTVRMAHD